ncbi:MAG: hypothetical protein N2327_04490 [Caldimicrobium sp.]|nr:hypothetical protein [Caldimicrobium sp.]MCX7873672.1 hypothetical protein [Caldimicrobium sp.]MDW8094638.1 hypothetical protein [Caldimicrobium sp.]
MEVKLYTLLPEKPEEYLNFGLKALKLSEEDLFKLYIITLKMRALSDMPIYKLLERAIPFIKFDELGKREYLITLSIYTFRQLLTEHLDLKFTKNLLLYLKEFLPKDFFQNCLPKREVVTSKDITFKILNSKEKGELPPYLKVKHLHLIFQLKDTCENLVKILPYLGLYAVRKIKNEDYEVFTPLNIAEFAYLTTVLTNKGLISKISAEGLRMQLKSLFPDCFGEI